jgi:hypothetical protein
VIPALAVFLALLFVGEALLFAFDRLAAVRAEQAYWRQRDRAPRQYDWERDGI